MVWPAPIRRTVYKGINWSQYIKKEPLVVVDHLWQAGGSKLGLIDSSLIICPFLTLSALFDY